jgi:hypothetical protein
MDSFAGHEYTGYRMDANMLEVSSIVSTHTIPVVH